MQLKLERLRISSKFLKLTRGDSSSKLTHGNLPGLSGNYMKLTRAFQDYNLPWEFELTRALRENFELTRALRGGV